MRSLIICSLFLATVAALAAAQGSQAQAEERSQSPANVGALPVVELFTSQGCSSCPAADKLMGLFAQRKDVVALTLPVDIWDYLGWKDTLASPKFTRRQRSYATRRGDGSVYTPQAIVNGRVHVVGSDAGAIEGALKSTYLSFEDEAVPLTAVTENGILKIHASAAADGSAAKEATLWLVTVRPLVEVNVKGGENGGHSLMYYNVVREITPVGMWTGKDAMVELPANEVLRADEKCAVLLQAGKGGPILAANWLH